MHMKEPLIIPYRGKSPVIHPEAFIAPTAAVTGDVHIGKESSVWFSSVIRGDESSVRIGEKTNIQDCCVVHGTLNEFSTSIGSFVTIGHGAILHGCQVGDRVLIGMGARLLDGSKVASESMIAAGTVIPEGFEVPPRTLVMGVPARVKRGLRDDEIEWIVSYAENYAQVRLNYMGREKEAKF
jgi:carbonic anhydrase/acetyltransferase-like protein (isoleucine patch superfamily)